MFRFERRRWAGELDNHVKKNEIDIQANSNSTRSEQISTNNAFIIKKSIETREKNIFLINVLHVHNSAGFHVNVSIGYFFN